MGWTCSWPCPGSSSTPKVIAMSGAGGEQNGLDVAKFLGARQTFQKPFSLPRLLDAVRYELAHRQNRIPESASFRSVAGHLNFPTPHVIRPLVAPLSHSSIVHRVTLKSRPVIAHDETEGWK